MDLTGSVIIGATREDVWRALNDPDVLSRCIEGVESLTRIASEDGEKLEGKMNAKVGPVRATFTGFVRLTKVIAGESYTLVGEGKGGVAGFAKGEADVALADTEAGHTLLSYNVRSSVGGKLAQLGGRLIEGTAKAYADGFFKNLKAELETVPLPELDTAAPVEDTSKVDAEAGLSPVIWASLLIVGVLGFLAWQWL